MKVPVSVLMKAQADAMVANMTEQQVAVILADIDAYGDAIASGLIRQTVAEGWAMSQNGTKTARPDQALRGYRTPSGKVVNIRKRAGNE